MRKSISGYSSLPKLEDDMPKDAESFRVLGDVMSLSVFDEEEEDSVEL